MPSNHLILCHPLLLLPSIFHIIKVFSNELALHIRWTNTGASASVNILPVNIQGWFPLGLTNLISFRIPLGLTSLMSKTFFFKTLHNCINFAKYQNESASGIHVFPILNPPPSSLPISSLWGVPVHQPQASSIVHRTWTGDSFHTWYFTCFNAILPNLPTLSLSHRVHKTVLFTLNYIFSLFLIKSINWLN